MRVEGFKEVFFLQARIMMGFSDVEVNLMEIYYFSSNRFGLAYSKGYQSAYPVQSVVVTKVKGTVYTQYDDKELAVPHPEFYKRIWDSQDIVTPAHGGENGGFFVMTNLIITPNQTRDVCAEVKFLRLFCNGSTCAAGV